MNPLTPAEERQAEIAQRTREINKKLIDQAMIDISLKDTPENRKIVQKMIEAGYRK